MEISDQKEIEILNTILDRLQENIVLYDNNGDYWDKIKIKQNNEYIKMLLKENSNAGNNVRKFFLVVKETIEDKKTTLNITETLINKKFGNIKTVCEHLFDFAKISYVERVEEEFNNLFLQSNKQNEPQF